MFRYVAGVLGLVMSLPFIYDSKQTMRYVRSFYTCVGIALDYKITWYKYPDEHPEFKEKTSALHLRSAQKMRRLCEKNAGLYIKVCQYLASLNHVLPPEWIETMRPLQDQAPFVGMDEVNAVFQEDFGKLPLEIYDEFDPVPIAAASLAQVHRARRKDGKEVAVKVQYRTLRDEFQGDMFVHKVIVHSAKYLFEGFNLGWMHEEVKVNLFKELDFIVEGQNAERCAYNFRNDPRIHVPEIDWDLTSHRIMTMEFINGYKITDHDALEHLGVSKKQVTGLMINSMSKQIFVDGFAHCDPHPGNLFIRKTDNGYSNWVVRTVRKLLYVATLGLYRPQPEWQLVILDHGLYKELSEQTRVDYCRLWRALIMQDDDQVRSLIHRLGVSDEYWPLFAMAVLMRPYKGFMTHHHNAPKSKEDIEKLRSKMKSNALKITEMMQQMPRELLLILRNQNYLRSLNKEMGIPVNRFTIMARQAVAGARHRKPASHILTPDNNHGDALLDSATMEELEAFSAVHHTEKQSSVTGIRATVGLWKDTLSFEFHLAFEGLTLWLAGIYLRFFQSELYELGRKELAEEQSLIAE